MNPKNPKTQKIKALEQKCLDCKKLFASDQYYFWCNECGAEHERKFFNSPILITLNKK